MAVTVNDLLGKKFKRTNTVEGYDPQEVDDFLNQAAVTLSYLQAENEELKRRLEVKTALTSYRS